MIEKPITNTVEDAKKIITLAKKNKSFILVAYCLRFYDPFIKMKEIVANGELGNVFSIRAVVSARRALTDAVSDYRSKRTSGGGIIHDYSHEIDYLKWFIEEKVKEIYCKGFNLEHREWDIFDTADIILEFENNKIGSIHMDYIQAPFRRSLEIYGTKGTLLWCNFGDIKFYSETSQKWCKIRVDKSFGKMYLKQLQHYIRCINSKDKPMVSGSEGL